MALPKTKSPLVTGLIFAFAAVAAMGLLAWLGMRQHTPEAAPTPIPVVAAKPVPVTLGQSQQIVLGLQAAPQLAQKYGGESRNAPQVALVAKVGQGLATKSAVAQTGLTYRFTLLAEPNILNGFTLPGGRIYITTALLNRLTTEGQLAAVLAHAIAQEVKQQPVKHLTQGLTADALISGGSALQDAMVTQLLGLRYSVAEENEADQLTLQIMADGGYSPEAYLGVLKILATAYYAGAQVEFFTTHPNDANRIALIQAGIAKLYPSGVPKVMSK